MIFKIIGYSLSLSSAIIIPKKGRALPILATSKNEAKIETKNTDETSSLSLEPRLDQIRIQLSTNFEFKIDKINSVPELYLVLQ